MRYVKQNKIYTVQEIRQENPNMSIPDDADCSSLGFEFLINAEPPIMEGFYAVEGAPKDNKQTWELIPIVETQEEIKAMALRYLQETDWVMSYKIAHDLGLSVIHTDSKKWDILKIRDDYISTLKDFT